MTNTIIEQDKDLNIFLTFKDPIFKPFKTTFDLPLNPFVVFSI